MQGRIYHCHDEVNGCGGALQVGEVLHSHGVRFVAMRCAGFDRVDVQALNQMGVKVPVSI